VADRYGVPAATHLINLLPAMGAFLALLLPLPWKSGTTGGGHSSPASPIRSRVSP